MAKQKVCKTLAEGKLFDLLDKLEDKYFLTANPDKLAIYDKTLRTCAGYFAEEIKQHNGNVKIFGKPFVEIYEAKQPF